MTSWRIFLNLDLSEKNKPSLLDGFQFRLLLLDLFKI